MGPSKRPEDDLDTLVALADPVRRAIYRHAVRAGGPIRVGDAADVAGVGRSLAAYHLRRLVDAGLLEAREEDVRGVRRVGRPAKVFTPARVQYDVSMPPRSYDLAARLLAAALDRESSARGRRVLAEVGRELGERIAQGAAAGRRSSALKRVARALEPYGYEPVHRGRGELCLSNCPFDAVRDEHRELICHMNLAIAEGLVSGQAEGVRADFEPREDGCCVTFRTG